MEDVLGLQTSDDEVVLLADVVSLLVILEDVLEFGAEVGSNLRHVEVWVEQREDVFKAKHLDDVKDMEGVKQFI